MNLRWLLAALVAVSLLAALDFWAIADFLFWRYRWFDTPMHLLGGAAIGLFAVGLSRTYRPFAFMLVIVCAALGWELFEYWAHVDQQSGFDYRTDTLHDILNDVIGASVVYIVARVTVWRTKA